MFNIPKSNIIESDSGFSVEVLGRAGIFYVQKGKSMKIDSEVLSGPSGLILYTNSITKWDAPYDNEPVNETTRGQIISNICEAFRFRGIEIQVQ